MSAKGITIVGASAGSGKTYRLTQEVTRAVSNENQADRVPLDGLVAVTYTRKADAELKARVRQKLVASGAFDDAVRLPLAYVGTVHAACLRLLHEFAIDAGVSPRVDVAGNDQYRLLRQALEAALPAELSTRLDRLAARLELRFDARLSRYDWLSPVSDIMDLARANRIDASRLASMATRSADGFLALLPRPEKLGGALDSALEKEIERSLKRTVAKADGTATTDKAIAFLKEANQRLGDDELTWRDWAKLSTLAASRACNEYLEPLNEVAARYEAHPRLHEELRSLIEAAFEAAATGLTGYQTWKERRHVVDYVDMLDRTLQLLGNAHVRTELADRLRFAVVDEFQDTSPVQLALFVELHKLAGRSVWVGDRKQCIFEYAGADPLLMDAVSSWVKDEGGKLDQLKTNYRSRLELVDACCTLFTEALASHGFSSDEVAVSATRSSDGLAELPPFGLFRLEANNKDEAADCVASGVQRMLQKPGDTPVVDRITKRARPVRAGDIAILVATNAEARLVAASLHARGLRAALAREGLLSTPEGTLADSALRWLIDPRDSLAAATLDALTGFEEKDLGSWLSARLQSAPDSANETSGWRAALAPVRALIELLSPSEALERTMRALAAVDLCARWPEPAQRIANLDALRALAAAYEDRCGEEREAATIAGLLRYFDAIRTPSLQRDEMLAADHQHVAADDASVTVVTYHKSKGLEWPVVVLGSLDRNARRDAFDVSPETDAKGFNATDPLAGRWIRYWPWPLGPVRNAPLADAAAQSPEGRRITRRESQERVRLLYVGFTRARDHLVLTVTMKPKRGGATPQIAWLEGLEDESGAPLLELPLDAIDGATAKLGIREPSKKNKKPTEVPIRVWRCTPERAARPKTDEAPRWFARPIHRDAPKAKAPFRIVPSSSEVGCTELREAAARAALGTAIQLPTAISLLERGIDHELLGNAIHGFLGSDVEGSSAEQRLERARVLLHAGGLAGVVRPESLVTAGDTLRAWVAENFPGAIWRREVPIDAAIESEEGTRRVNGVIDLLLELGNDCILIDHKTFPGTTEGAWRAKCRDFIPQLVTYAELIRRVEGRNVVGCWVHFPVGGGMLEVHV